MKITILTLFPKMIKSFFNESIIKRAQEKGLVEISLVDLRDFAVDKHGTVDSRPYGGGVGMILRADVIEKALEKSKIKSQKSKIVMKNSKLKEKVILTSPKGKIFNQDKAISYSKLDHLVIICGHYEGVDERVKDYIDEEISIGDFILTGGEIASTLITDSVVRLIPGVLKKEKAVVNESFFQVPIDDLIQAVKDDSYLKQLKNKGVKKLKLLEYPQYTRPLEFKGKKVPSVLVSGDHAKIKKWQLKKAYQQTLNKRPDLLKRT